MATLSSRRVRTVLLLANLGLSRPSYLPTYLVILHAMNELRLTLASKHQKILPSAME